MTVTTIPAQQDPPSGPQGQSHNFSTGLAFQRADSQKPNVQGDGTDQTSYILTLYTSPAHHKSMNQLRETYFPAKLNKIPAHITLFHALPGSKLESDVLPAIEEIAAKTSDYRIKATRPFRLHKGIGIAVADDIEHYKQGRSMTRIIHAELRDKWGSWLSDQDATPIKMHYTVMNKVNEDATIDKALTQIIKSFKKGEDVSGGHFDHEGKNQSQQHGSEGKHEKLHVEGEVSGLTLWKYEKSGHWTHPKQFKFQGVDA